MTTDYRPQLERLARVFNDDTPPPKIIPTKPDDPQSVLSLPPSRLAEFHHQTDPQQVVDERLATLKSLDTKEQTQPQTDPQHLPQTDPLPTLTKEQTDNIHKQELSQLPRVGLERVETEQPIKRGRGRPKGSKNKQTKQAEKVSQRVSHSSLVLGGVLEGTYATNNGSKKVSREMKKVSHSSTSEYAPVNLNIPAQTSVKGKTSLCYALIYARELTPIQIEALLASQGDLNLTSAEVIALSLIDRTLKHDQKAEKIYWDLLKNEQKNTKITPEKPENTLLDDALAKAENAIFGEIVDTEN